MPSLCADSSHSNQSEPALEAVQKSVLSIYLSTPELCCLSHLESGDLKYCISYIPGNYFFFYMTIYPHLGIFNLLRASLKVIEVVWLSQTSWHKKYFQELFFKCLIISKSVGCSKVRDFQDFIPELETSNRLPVFICGCTAKVTLLRSITLQGHPGIHLLLQLCPFALLFWQQWKTAQKEIC